jgi:hypothetical protein
MTAGAPSTPQQRRVSASPIWLQLRDTFTGRAPASPVSVALERRDGTRWLAFPHAHQLSPYGDLAFVNLGRTGHPATVGTFDVRVTVSVAGSVTVAADGAPTVTRSVTAWTPRARPATPAPETLSLFPGPDYPFSPQTPLLAGQVVLANGDPVPRARVWATETVQNALRTEEVRSGRDGRFRLPLRWSAGATDVNAALGADAGSITVIVPADLSLTHQITLT